MDPEDMVDRDRSEIESSRADELNGLALLFILGASGGGAVGRVLGAAWRARLPAVVPATRAVRSAARAAKTPTTPPAAPRAGSAAPSAGARPATTGAAPASAPPAGSATPPAVPFLDPVKAVNDAISKVETPVFFPSRIANTYIEIVKLLSHGGWSVYLLDKYAEKGCSDVCPFTGNGEFSPVPVQKPAVAVQLPAEVDEKHHSVGDKGDAEGVAVQVPDKVNEKHHSEGDKEDSEGGEKQPADGDYACFFHEIGKKAYDLLYQDYNTGLKMVSDCKVLDTAVLLSDGSEQVGKASLGFELSSDTKLIKLTLDDVLRPGLKGLLSIPVSSQSSSKVDLQYRHLGACITGSSELQGSPIVSFSAMIGTKSIALGADVSVITKSLDALGAVGSLETQLLRFPKYTCGLVLSEGDVGASFTMENADVLTATYHQKLDETTSIAAKVQRVLSSNDSTLTAGFSHSLDPNTTVKAKLGSDGAVSVLLRYGPKPKRYVAFSAESNSQAPQKDTKFGLCVALGA
ncbi:hypothetical protein CFC21_096667 [Triticum aestivum]|uniref:Uncharacterized protein n=2 Tax=Triticum aestivum TaxID=4565 RepID=A0A9R1MYX1_WHEAT|nr:uncharacterized protein LOC123150715 isoform X1 [Triticum aestivum]KAF7094347.1 hypothetical protein CFC21_096667 [Triticum aestivum]